MIQREYLAIAALAAVVGLPGAFFTIALPAQMRDEGASLFQIGLVWIVWLPSALKWFWAPLLERLAIGVRSRPWAILACAVALAVGFLVVVPLADSMAIGPLIALAVICAAISLSLQLLYNGWIMHNLESAAQGRANGFAAAGMVTGGIIGGGVLPWTVGIWGWWYVIALISVGMMLAGFAGFALRNTASIKAPSRISFFKGWKVLVNPPLLVCIALVGLSAGADMTLPARLVDAGLSSEQVGLVLGTVALVLIVPASLLAGWCAGRWSLALCFPVCAALKAALLLGLAVSPTEADVAVSILSVADFVLAGALTVLTWQFYMHHAQGATPVASYAVLTSADALARFASAPAAGLLADRMGYGPLFVIATFLIIGAAALVRYLMANPA